MYSVYAEFETQDMSICYLTDTHSSSMGLSIFPKKLKQRIAHHREDISDQQEARVLERFGPIPCGATIEPLVHIHCLGDTQTDGFASGFTMRDSSTTKSVRFVSQSVQTDEEETRVETFLSTENMLHIRHVLSWGVRDSYIRCYVVVSNEGEEEVTLLHCSSFTLGNITPFDDHDASEKLYVHRFKSFWSAEGRHGCELLEDMALESSWSNHGIRNERFGQIGSMPVRSWFPFVALEDRCEGVFWGASMQAPASWQLELCRRDDHVRLSGGRADYEFGHWKKILHPQEAYRSTEALLTTCEGSLDEVCERLLPFQKRTEHPLPPSEHTLPIIYNEWCTSWGNPTESSILSIVPLLEDLGITYCVIDAGWWKAEESTSWSNSQGGWEVCPTAFPNGFTALCDTIRAHGIVPGIWFEYETVGCYSPLANKKEWLLHRDGYPIRSGSRFFLDVRNQEVRNYLKERVIGLLKQYQFGYMKIDYNETIGIGCDGGDSLGEALQEHIRAVQQFIKSVRQEVPHIVLENCSSGGHRLESSFIGITDMSSFSDAHETLSIPIIAANLHRLILPQKCQIWAVLHPQDTIKRLYYSLCATFLGRMCLSGELHLLPESHLHIVKEAIRYYKEITQIIISGRSRRFGPAVSSYRHPTGWQAIVRVDSHNEKALVVLHTYGAANQSITLPLEDSHLWNVHSYFSRTGITVSLEDEKVRIDHLEEFDGVVILLCKDS